MPHLVQMDKRYSKKGLQVIGAEVQGSGVEDIEQVIKDQKMKFTVTKGIRGPNLSNGIPHAAVFDVSGKLVYHGHPMSDDFEKSVKRELKKVKAGEPEGDATIFGARKTLVPERTWTNSDGKTLQAALISVTAGTGTFRKANGQTFEYAISKLSEEDQETIAKAEGGDGG